MGNPTDAIASKYFVLVAPNVCLTVRPLLGEVNLDLSFSFPFHSQVSQLSELTCCSIFRSVILTYFVRS